MGDVEVIVPWRPGCPYREAALNYVRGTYPEGVSLASGPWPWCKGRAVMPALERGTSPLVVIADADVFCEGIAEAVSKVRDGAPWAMPHGTVHRLTEEATAAVIAGEPWEGQRHARAPYEGRWGGGIVIARRETLIDIPLDPRFIGWGQEDLSWSVALHHLAGPAWRGYAPLVHLWHPPQERDTPKRGNMDGWRLWRRYLAARASRDEMRQLVEEAKRAYHLPPDTSLHDPASRS